MDARRNDARVVEHQQIIGPQQTREIRELPIGDRTARYCKVQQPAARSLRRRPLCNQLVGKFVGKVAAPHGARTVAGRQGAGKRDRHGRRLFRRRTDPPCGTSPVSGSDPQIGPSLGASPEVPSDCRHRLGAGAAPHGRRRDQKCLSNAAMLKAAFPDPRMSSGMVISNVRRFFIRRTLSFSFSPA